MMEDAIVLKLVQEIRNELPNLGTRKLYHMLQPKLEEHRIKMGRDALYDLLAGHGLLIRRKRRRKPLTTDSRHPYYKYSNLVQFITLFRINQVWVSDITYIRVVNGFAYLSLITDAYSRKVLGYHLQNNLSSDGAIKALKMALENSGREKNTAGLIHHSDRGAQYCCYEYTGILKENFIAISMTKNGDPYENALAERINGILKTEFNLDNICQSFDQASVAVSKAVKNYNELRPHMSLQLQTPNSVHENLLLS